MDLFVEAEAFGSPVHYCQDEVTTISARIIETEEDAERLQVPAVGAGRTGECIKAFKEVGADVLSFPPAVIYCR